MSRRSFLRWSALVGSSAAASKGLAAGFRRRDPRHVFAEAARSGAEERMIRTGCPAHNCGGRCLLIVHVQDGRIVRLETDDRPPTRWPRRSCAPASAAGPTCAASTTPTGCCIR